MLRLSINF